MNARYAVIDCGSNSFRLLIADVIEDTLVELYRDFQMVRLGSGLHAAGGIINNDTTQRCISALRYFKKKIEEYQCSSITCVGTSALRSASNSQEFCEEVYRACKISITIIDGQTEALYSYYGATHSTHLLEGTAVLDIGGGSTEIAIAKTDSLWSLSLPLGAVRLTNMFWGTSNNPSAQDLQNIHAHVKESWLKNISPKELNIKRFIGVAGTITTVAALKHQLKIYDSYTINGTKIFIKEIQQILASLTQMDNQQRHSVAGMFPPQRADIIVAGIAILLATMDAWQQEIIEIRDTCLLQGAILADIKI